MPSKPAAKDTKDTKAEAKAEPKAKAESTTSNPTKEREAEIAALFDRLDENANQARAGGHPDLVLEADLFRLRELYGPKGKPSKLMPTEGQSWPTTDQAGFHPDAQYAQPTVMSTPGNEGPIEGDPYRDAAAIEKAHNEAVKAATFEPDS